MPVLDKKALMDLYRKRAGFYDLSANLYYLIGFRENAYRKRAVEALGLGPGDTVVEVACGTGLNFPLFQKAIGPEGKIIGVDMTDAMLKKAEQRVRRKGWGNVELVLSDAASFRFPAGVGGIVSSFALTLVPEFDKVVRSGYFALSPGKRFVVLDFRLPPGRKAALAPPLAFLTRPFGVSMELAGRHPWESIERYFGDVTMQEFYLGFAYVASGQKQAGAGIE